MTIHGIAHQGTYRNVTSSAGASSAPSSTVPQTVGDSVQLSGPSGQPSTSVTATAAATPQVALPGAESIVMSRDFKKMMEYFRGMQDGLPGVPGSGFPARLALAMGGEVEFPGAPVDSMLERSFADSHPDASLAPAFHQVAVAGIPTSCEALVDLAENMIKAVPMDYNQPMEKAYAAIRLQVGLAKCLGETRIVPKNDDGSDGFLVAVLGNLKRNAQSQALAQVTVNEVMREFGRLRDVARKFDQAGSSQPGNATDAAAGAEPGSTPVISGGLAAAAGYTPPSAIQVNHEEHYVNIGGVKVAIRH